MVRLPAEQGAGEATCHSRHRPGARTGVLRRAARGDWDGGQRRAAPVLDRARWNDARRAPSVERLLLDDWLRDVLQPHAPEGRVVRTARRMVCPRRYARRHRAPRISVLGRVFVVEYHEPRGAPSRPTRPPGAAARSAGSSRGVVAGACPRATLEHPGSPRRPATVSTLRLRTPPLARLRRPTDDAVRLSARRVVRGAIPESTAP